jgi:hypothetical protein
VSEARGQDAGPGDAGASSDAQGGDEAAPEAGTGDAATCVEQGDCTAPTDGGSVGGAVDGGAVDAAGPDSSVCTPTAYYRDRDGDGHGSPLFVKMGCEQPEDYVANDTDCDDSCESCYPGGEEVCDYEDNDCDEDVDEGLRQVFYVDADGDGFGDPARATSARCEEPDSDLTYVDNGEDCHDDVPFAHPNQHRWFEDAIDGTANDFDYNCDGNDSRRYRHGPTCDRRSNCYGGRWANGVELACGQSGTYERCNPVGTSCLKIEEDLVQQCH